MTPAGTREFTPDQIDRALTALALQGENSERARDMLKHDETFERVPTSRAILLWKHKHAARFQELLEERAPQVETAMVHDYRAIVARTNQVHLQGLERAAQGLDDLDAKDAAAAVKNLAIAGGVAADKLLVFTDRPNVIHAHPDPMNTLTLLMTSLGIPQAGSIPSTADEIPSSALIRESSESNAREQLAGESLSG